MLPDISNNKMMPVSGARTIAVKNPVIPSNTKLLMYTGSRPKNSAPVIANTAPSKAPNIRSGKKIPPGAPEPKLTAENKNFTTNVSTTIPRTISPFVRLTINPEPLPNTDGITSPSTPAVKNAINKRPVSFKNGILRYNSCAFNIPQL